MLEQTRAVPVVLAGAGLLGVAALSGAVATAQDVPNPVLSFSLGSTFKADDNLALNPKSAGTSTWIDNRFGLTYATETATSSLSFGASVVWRLSDLAGQGQDSSLDDKTLRFSYALQGANSALSVTANYNRADVAFFDVTRLIPDPTNPIDSADLTAAASGTRENRSAAVKFQTGIEGPWGMNLSASHNERNYSGTTDPDFYDTTRDNVSVGFTIRPRATTGLTLTLSQSDYSAADAEQTERSTQRATFGLKQDLDRRTALTLSLGKTWLTTDKVVGGTPEHTAESGFNGSLGLSRDLANGSVGLQLSHDVSYVGNPRTDLMFQREMDLPRGHLSVSAGPSFQSGGQSGFAGTLAYSHALPRGALNAQISRRYAVNDADNAVETTRERLSWNQELTPVSGLDLSFDYLTVNSDAVGEDRDRARLEMAYRVELTKDWRLTGGYSHTYYKRELGDSARSNSVFLTLGRTISFAP